MLSMYMGLPISTEQGKARGINPDACQLVIRGRSRETHEALCVLEHAFAGTAGQPYVLIVGAFQSRDTLTEVFQEEPMGDLWEGTIYRVNGPEALVAALARLDAEEAAVFSGTGETISRFLEAVGAREAPWWRLSTTTVFGALTHRSDLVDLVALYEPNEGSVEILGTRASVLSVFDKLRKVAFDSVR